MQRGEGSAGGEWQLLRLVQIRNAKRKDGTVRCELCQKCEMCLILALAKRLRFYQNGLGALPDLLWRHIKTEAPQDFFLFWAAGKHLHVSWSLSFPGFIPSFSINSLCEGSWAELPKYDVFHFTGPQQGISERTVSWPGCWCEGSWNSSWSTAGGSGWKQQWFHKAQTQHWRQHKSYPFFKWPQFLAGNQW